MIALKIITVYLPFDWARHFSFFKIPQKIVQKMNGRYDEQGMLLLAIRP